MITLLKNIWNIIKNAIGWIILIAILIIGLTAGIIFAGYIILYILGVFIGVMLIIGFLYLILKLIGFK